MYVLFVSEKKISKSQLQFNIDTLISISELVDFVVMLDIIRELEGEREGRESGRERERSRS